MAIVADLIGAFSASGLLGGITGLIGSELKSRRELKMMKLEGELAQASWPERQKERDHETAMRSGNREHEIALHELNLRAKSEEDERAIIAQEVVNSGKGLVEAIRADMTPKGMTAPEHPYVGAVRSLVRPVALVLLLILTGIAFAFSPADVRAKIVAALLYLTTLAVSFYFGDRPSSALKKMLIGGAV